MNPPFARKLPHLMAWIPLMFVLLSLASSGVQAATRSPALLSGGVSNLTAGFESRLWEQLYREDSDDQKAQDDEAIPDHAHQTAGTSATSGRLAQDQLRSVQAEQVASHIVTGLVNETRQEDDTQESNVPGVISDWNIAKLSATNGELYTPRSSGGPTATTVLVGLVAAIVLMGAIFSGKE